MLAKIQIELIDCEWERAKENLIDKGKQGKYVTRETFNMVLVLFAYQSVSC